MDDRNNIWDFVKERFAKMPLLVRVFVVTFTGIGLLVGVLFAGRMAEEGIRWGRWLMMWVAGFGCIGFFVGLVVGCIVEAFAGAAAETRKKRKKKRKRVRYEDDEDDDGR